MIKHLPKNDTIYNLRSEMLFKQWTLDVNEMSVFIDCNVHFGIGC